MERGKATMDISWLKGRVWGGRHGVTVLRYPRVTELAWAHFILEQHENEAALMRDVEEIAKKGEEQVQEQDFPQGQ